MYIPSFRLILVSVLVAVLTVWLSACGFQLRGQAGNKALEQYNIVLMAQSSPSELERLMASSLPQKTHAKESADVLLSLAEPALKKRMMTRSATGRASEFELLLEVQFRLKKGDNIKEHTVSARREYLYDSTQLLAIDEQEQSLLRDMQSDLVQQILTQVQLFILADDQQNSTGG